MKAVAQWDQDLADIRKIVEIAPALDRGRIEYWVRQFGEAMDDPGLWDRIEPLLKTID